jgi:hypothetical protein
VSDTLDAALQAAHTAGDAAALVDLYTQAAQSTQDENRAAFYLTHAHVFALEIDHPEVGNLRAALVKAGREVPLPPPIPPFR